MQIILASDRRIAFGEAARSNLSIHRKRYPAKPQPGSVETSSAGIVLIIASGTAIILRGR